jgi:hypothetical protein
MATAGSRWGVVMSRNAGFSDQVSMLPVLFTRLRYKSQRQLEVR